MNGLELVKAESVFRRKSPLNSKRINHHRHHRGVSEATNIPFLRIGDPPKQDHLQGDRREPFLREPFPN